MRIAIVVVALALLVSTAAFAVDNTWVANGGPQEYWGSFGSSMWGGYAGAHGDYNNYLTATAQVNNFAYDHVNNGNIDFTIGDPRLSVTGTYDGHMTVNTPCIWTIMCVGGSAGAPGFFQGPGGATMPCTWGLRVGGLTPTLNVIANGLQTTLPALDADYHIDLTVIPGGGLQAPGAYVLDPSVSIRPQG